MAAPANSFLVEALRQHRLLEPAQLDEVVRRLQARLPEPKQLARELLQRGWITAFQANYLLQGKAGDLVLGSYVLLERLGEGGMGQVFKAHNRKLDKIVALKLIRKERLTNAKAVKRFYREIRAAAQLDHPNIVRALDADEVNGTHLLAMEYVHGIDLNKLVKQQGPLDVRRACECIRQAALGLQHAYEQGMVHRDIKPHNLLLISAAEHTSNATDRVKILDMGLARLDADTDGDASSSMTQEGAVMGTPDYIAPEQGCDSHNVDTRADLYSLGCTLHFLLTGQPPFSGGTLMEKLIKHQQQTPAPVRQLRSDVPPAVEAIVARLLAKRPEQRYQTPAELAAALAAAMSGSAMAVPVAVSGVPPSAVPVAGVPVAAIPVAGALPAAPVAADSASTQNAFSDLHSGNTPSSSSMLIQSGTRRRGAAPNQRVVQWALAAAAGVVAIIMLAVVIRAISGKAKPSEDPATKQAKTEKPQKTLAEIAAEQEKQQEAEERRQKEAEAKKRLADEDRARRQWRAREEAKRKQGNAAAEAAFPELEKRLKAAGADFAAGAKEVRTFLAKHGGTAAALRAAERLTRLPAPFDALDPAGLPEDAQAAWHAMGQEPPKELVGVVGEYRGRHWGAITSVQLGGAKKNIIVTRAGNTTCLWELASRLPRHILPPADLWSLSPDGLQLAAATYDGMLRVYEVDTGKETWQVNAYPKSGVRSLAFSPDGRTIATGGGLNRANGVGGENPYTLKLWDVVAGKSLGTSNFWDNQLLVLAYAPDSKAIAAWNANGSLGLFDGHTAQMLKPLGAFPGAVSLALSPDSKVLAVLNGSGGKSVLHVLDPASNKALLKAEGLAGDTGHLAFSPDGRRLFHGDYGANIRMWQTADFTLAREWQAHKEGGLTSFLFNKDGSQLWTSSGFNSGELKIWETDSGKKLRTIAGYETNAVRQVTALSMSSDGKTVAWSCADNSIRVWDVERKAVRATVKLNSIGPYALSADGRHLVAGDLNGVRVWDIDAGREVQPLAGHMGDAWNVAIDPQCRFIASLSSGGDARLWAMPKGREQHMFVSNFRRIFVTMNDLLFTGDGKWLVMPHADAHVRLWDVADPEEHADHTAEGSIVSLDVSPDGGTLAMGTFNGLVWLKTLAKSDLKVKLNPNADNARREVFCVAFNPNGSTLAAGTVAWEKPLHLFDVETGDEVQTFLGQDGHVYSVAFSPDGRQLVSGSSEGSVRLWDVSEGKLHKLMRGHLGAVSATLFSHDGTRIFSAGHDGRIVVWDVSSGVRLHEWQFPGSVFGLALAADGRHLAAANANGTISILRLPKDLAVPQPLAATQAQEQQRATAKKVGMPVQITNSISMKLNLIPAGRFLMGSPEEEPGRLANESPRHSAVIPQPFFMGTHDVTVGQFRRFVEAAKYRTEAESDGRGAFSRETSAWAQRPDRNWLKVEFAQEDDHPVVNVSSKDADAFCKWLSGREKKTYRLPSEAEWEYACRAGGQTAFTFGATLEAKHANYISSGGKTTRVGAFPPNAFGLFDMHGNVSQWCAETYTDGYRRDRFGSDALLPADRPGIARGGSWFSASSACRCAYRDNPAREYRSSALGFRVVCEVSAGTTSEK